jgi:hypothetical protein
VYGPVRTVVWQGAAGDRRPMLIFSNHTFSAVLEPSGFRLGNVSALSEAHPRRSAGEHGALARFRYSDLKEALGLAGQLLIGY